MKTKQDLLAEIGKLNNQIKKYKAEIRELHAITKPYYQVINADLGETLVKAIGTAKIINPKILRVNIRYFELLIKAYKTFFADEKESMDIIFNYDQPIMIGTWDKKKKEAVGFMLAPRSEEE